MPITIKQAIEETVIGPGEIADLIGRDKSNTRAEALKLVRSGRLTARNNGNGYAFFPALSGHVRSGSADGARHFIGPIDGAYESQPTLQSKTQVIDDVSYKDVTPSAAGRPLVVTQPADSRMDMALRQHARALTRAGQASQGRHMPEHEAALLNQLFVNDPDAAETAASLQQTVEWRLRAQTEHEQWVRQEHARLLQERQEREAQAEKKRKDDEIHDAIQRMLGLKKDEEPPSHRRANGHCIVYGKESEPPPVDRYQRQREAEARETEQTKERRPVPIAELLARAKANKPTKEEPPAKSWWARHFAAPKKAVWK
jgi:hypothetical protein